MKKTSSDTLYLYEFGIEKNIELSNKVMFEEALCDAEVVDVVVCLTQLVVE